MMTQDPIKVYSVRSMNEAAYSPPLTFSTTIGRTTALYIDVVAMAPQLVLISKIRGEVEALTSHFVAATALSRLTSLIFWYHGFAELAPLDGSFNLAGWAIIAAHVLQVLLLGDFLFYYIRAVLKTGSARFELPTYVDV